jgi:hypothetical protein
MENFAIFVLSFLFGKIGGKLINGKFHLDYFTVLLKKIFFSEFGNLLFTFSIHTSPASRGSPRQGWCATGGE